MSIVKTENLSKQFGKVRAVDRINIEINPGEVYGFIGPNGAGKTTTMRLLLGIIRASEGHATIFGKDAWKDAVEIHKRLAYVPGDVHLWSNLTGGEVIDFFVRLRGSDNKKHREALIERFDLDPTKKCRAYSKGNRQKIALITAFASNADLLILDEPTSGLDPLMENVFQECVTEHKKDGKSIFLSSHILSEVEKLCDRVSIIRQGKIIETGTLTELRHLTRTQIVMQTEQNADKIIELPYVHNLTENDMTLTFQIDSEYISDLLKEIAPLGVKRFESMPPKLEDLFMRHYKNTEEVVL